MKEEIKEILEKIRGVFSIIFPIDSSLLEDCTYQVSTKNEPELHIWIPLKLEKFGKACKFLLFQKVEDVSAAKVRLDLNLESRFEYDLFPESCNYTIMFESPEERKERINSLLHMVVEEAIKDFEIKLNEAMIVKLYFVSLLGAEDVFNSYMARFLADILKKSLPDLYQNFRTLLGNFLSIYGKAYLQKIRERIIPLLGAPARKSMLKYVVQAFNLVYDMYKYIITKVTALEENNLIINPLGKTWVEILLNHENNKMTIDSINTIIKNIDFTINKQEEDDISQSKSFIDNDISEKRNSVFMVKNLEGFKDYKIKFFILEMLFFRGEHYLPEPLKPAQVKKVKSNCTEDDAEIATYINEASELADVSERIEYVTEQNIGKIKQKCIKMDTEEKTYYSFLVKMEGQDCELGLKYDKVEHQYLDIVDTHPVFWYGVSCFRMARMRPPTINY
jgi:hypothetical protein